MVENVLARSSRRDLLPAETVRSLIEHATGRLKPTTREGYRRDLTTFAAWLGAASPDAAADLIVGCGPGQANATLLRWITDQRAEGMSAATINRRLSSVRSVVRTARLIGLISWTIDIRSEKRAPIRDTRGPGEKNVRKLLAWAQSQPDRPQARRDAAILHLLAGLALRRGEVCSLDVGHVDLKGERIAVMGKGRDAREWLTLPRVTRSALARWLEVHPDPETSAPLFVALMERHRGNRLTGCQCHRIVRVSAERAGIGRVWPHSLRHSAITHGLDLTNGDVRTVRQYSRHRTLDVLLVYDDARNDSGGKVADLVASSFTR